MSEIIEEQPNIVSIEYCKSCDSHNWCTHHNEDKYRQAYLDLATDIRKKFKNIHVQGNQLPSTYVPVKAKQNKYYDSLNKKYVLFPSIGAFQVKINGVLIFSKRQSNSWPCNSQILKTISSKLNSKEEIKNSFEISDVKTEKETVAVANKFLNQIDKNSTFYKYKPKQQFTLTDHFKRYKMKQKAASEDFDYLYAESEPSNHQQPRISKLTPQDLQNLHQIWGKKSTLPNFIKEKAYMEEKKGKKEMLVNLSSIQEQNEMRDKQNLKPGYNSIKSRPNVSASTVKSKHSILEKDFDTLQKKFRRFEHKVSEVHSKNFNPTQSLVQKQQILKISKNYQNYKYSQPKFSIADKIKEVTQTYNGQMLLKEIRDKKKMKIEEYIRANSDYKNQQLQQIYGREMVKRFSPSAHKKRPKIKKSKNLKMREVRNTNDQQVQSSSSNLSEQLSSRLIGEQDSNTDIEIPPIMEKKTDKPDNHQITKNSFYSKSNNKQFRDSQAFSRGNFRSTGQNFRKKNFVDQPKKNSPNQNSKNTKSKIRLGHSKSEIHKITPLSFSMKKNVQKNNISEFSSSSSEEEIQTTNNKSNTGSQFMKNQTKNNKSKRMSTVTKISQRNTLQKSSFELKAHQTETNNESNKLKKMRKNKIFNQEKQSTQKRNSSVLAKVKKANNDSVEKKKEKDRNSLQKKKKLTKRIQEEDEEKQQSFFIQKSQLEENQKNENDNEEKEQNVHKINKKQQLCGRQQQKESEEQEGVQQQDLQKNVSHQFSNKTQQKNIKRLKKKDQKKQKLRQSVATQRSVSTVKSKASKRKDGKSDSKTKISLIQKPNKSRFKDDKQVDDQKKEGEIQSLSSQQSINHSTQIKQQKRIEPDNLKKSKVSKNRDSKRKEKSNSKRLKKKQSEKKSQSEENRQSSITAFSKKSAQKKIQKKQSKRNKSEGKDTEGSQKKDKKRKKSNDSKKSRTNSQNSVGKQEKKKKIKKQDKIIQQIDNVDCDSVAPTAQMKSKYKQTERADYGVQVDKPKQKKIQTQLLSQEEISNNEQLITKKKQKKQNKSQQKSEKALVVGNISKQKSSSLNNKAQKSNSKNCSGCRSKTSSNGNSVHTSQFSNKFNSSKSGKTEKSKQIAKNIKQKDNKLQKKSLSRKYARAQIISQFFGQNYENSILQHKNHKNIVMQRKNMVLFGKQNIEPQKIVDSSSGKLNNLLKVIKMLCNRNQFIIVRLFENPQICDQTKFTVWLCQKYRWAPINVQENDEQIQNIQGLNHTNFQYWPIILQKALCKLFGSFQNLCNAELAEIFHALTGSNYLSFKVKQDPSKNKNLLKFITANEKKNFIVYAQKRLISSIKEQQQNTMEIFTIISQKSVQTGMGLDQNNSTSNNEIILRMKREGKNESFWIKLDKFVTEFTRVDVLQLRINHNFTYISLKETNKIKNGVMRVIQINFNEEQFGSLAIAVRRKDQQKNQDNIEDNRGVQHSLRTDFKLYLYKQEQSSNVLRLVGQIKEKNKPFVFFDCYFQNGKYLLFAQHGEIVKNSLNNYKYECQVSYMGEGKPHIKLREQITGNGLKNDFTEYVPVEAPKRNYEEEGRKMPRFMMSEGFSPGNSRLKGGIQSYGGYESRASMGQSRGNFFNKDELKSQFVNFLTNN